MSSNTKPQNITETNYIVTKTYQCDTCGKTIYLHHNTKPTISLNPIQGYKAQVEKDTNRTPPPILSTYLEPKSTQD